MLLMGELQLEFFFGGRGGGNFRTVINAIALRVCGRVTVTIRRTE